jgi:hypothetical protein
MLCPAHSNGCRIAFGEAGEFDGSRMTSGCLMTEPSSPARVVAAAREWIGTPYRHMADVEGAGRDCVILPAPVYCDFSLIEPLAKEAATRLAPS